jgi:L,D-transpeptidase ErfK/SrfK
MSTVTGIKRQRQERDQLLLWSLVVMFVGALASGIAHAHTFNLPPPGEDVVGESQWVTVEEGETLPDIALRYGFGYRQMRLANPLVDPWLPQPGTDVLLPATYILPPGPREGLVLNLPEMRLYYFPPPAEGESAVVKTFPVSIGRGDWSTPVTETVVKSKVADPVWTPPASIRAEHAEQGEILPEKVLPGEDNPLGRYALRLALPSYLIHGTNKVYGIGMQVTHGCVRLYPTDIETLYQEVPVGTPLRIINEPYKLGWRDGVLYLVAHAPLDGIPPQPGRQTEITKALIRAAGTADVDIDWGQVEAVEAEARGVPTPVARTDRFGVPAGRP